MNVSENSCRSLRVGQAGLRRYGLHEMKSKMQMMMEKIGKERAMVKDQVIALETDVQSNTPDSKQVAAHTNALLKHFAMMSQKHGGKAGKKNMEMKTKPQMKM